MPARGRRAQVSRILIVGCGRLGLPLARRLAADGHRITGVTRTPRPPLPGLDYLTADVTQAPSLAAIQGAIDHAIVILPPGGRSEPAYRLQYQVGLHNLLARFQQLDQPPRCLLVSSTSVFAQCRGEWVNEASPTRPQRHNGRYLLAAEQALHRYRADSVVVRFSGIYGGDRLHLLRQLQHAAQVQKTPPYYTNRIHQDDCVGVLLHLSKKCLAGEPVADCYIASDRDHASKWELACWLAAQTGRHPPQPQQLDAAAPQNKRCDSRRLLASGYAFTYPGFRQGYAAILAALQDPPNAGQTC